MASRSFSAIAKAFRFRHLAVATSSLAALATADPAWAQCATTTAGGVTSLTCGNTVTTNATNTNENNPSTTARAHRYAGTINVNIAQGVTVSGLGLLIWPTGNNPLTVTNNGTVSHTAGETANGQPVNGLEIIGNGGLVTYLGNGSATTNATPPALASGLSISNTNGGGINIGAANAPITGATFSGESGFVARAPSGGFINAWFSGGTFTGTNPGNDALELNGLGNVTLVMTGQSVLNGSLNVGVFGNAPAASIISATTDARITATLGIAMLVSGVSGETNATLTSGASIIGQAGGVALFSDGGVMRLTTAAGTTIQADGNNAGSLGVQFQPGGTGSVVADLSGAISAGGAGIFLRPSNGNVAITIREGATVSGGQVGYTVLRINETGVIDVLNLGTISSPITAADFDGTLRIGNGGTSGTIVGNVINGGTLIFNRSDAVTYAGIVSGTGALTKQGTGTLTLTGASTYTGATNVSAGTLLVNGSLTSAVTVANGASLGGTGSVGGTTISGTLSPGGDGVIGTMTINGNLVFGAGSNFRVDVGNSQGTTDRILVTGTASLAGSLTAIASNGTFTAGSYILLTANGGLTGAFNPITTQPDAPVRVQNVGNDVTLFVDQGSFSLTTSERQSITFTAPVVTTSRVNAFSTQIIGRLLGGQPLYDQTFAAAFNSATVQNSLVAARAAITTAGGPGVIIGDPVRTSSATTTATTPGASTFALTNTQSTREQGVLTFGPATLTVGALSTCNVSSLPSTTRPTCVAGGTTLVLGLNDTNLNVNTNVVYTVSETRTDTTTDTLRETWELTGQVATVGVIHAEVQSGLFDLGGRLLGRLGAVEAGSAGWGEVYHFRVSQSGRRDAWGLAGGFGLALAPGVTLAAGIDHGQLDIDVPGALETGEVELTEIGAALRFDSGPFTASLAAVHGFGNAETRRTIIGQSDADYDVRLTGVGLDLSYAIETGGWTLRPGAGLDYISLSTDGFTESDTLGLIVADQSADRVRASAGLSIERDFGGVALSASARYLAVLSGDERSLPVAFAIAPGRILDMSAPGEPDGLLLGARLAVPLSPAATFFIGYGGRFGGDYEAHAGTAGIRMRF